MLKPHLSDDDEKRASYQRVAAVISKEVYARKLKYNNWLTKRNKPPHLEGLLELQASQINQTSQHQG